MILISWIYSIISRSNGNMASICAHRIYTQTIKAASAVLKFRCLLMSASAYGLRCSSISAQSYLYESLAITAVIYHLSTIFVLLWQLIAMHTQKNREKEKKPVVFFYELLIRITFIFIYVCSELQCWSWEIDTYNITVFMATENLNAANDIELQTTINEMERERDIGS